MSGESRTGAPGGPPDGAEAARTADGDEAATVRPREGSTLHYALLWTAAEARERFLARLGLVVALSRTLDHVHDRGVAERKVHWWHEELERLRAGEPRHPRTVACAGPLAGLEAANAACLDVLSVAATTRYTPPADDAERRARLVRDHGARLALLAHALSGRAADLEEPDIRNPGLAFALGLHETLARLPTLLHRGFAVFSDADYARHGLSPVALAREVRRRPEHGETDEEAGGETSREGGRDRDRGESRGEASGKASPGARLSGIPVVAAPPERGPMIAASVAAARRALDDALADPAYRATYSRRELAPLARIAAIRARQLRLWQEQAPDLLRENVTPTPLAKLLVAWRHRRGAPRPRPSRDGRDPGADSGPDSGPDSGHG